jgi:hypothetical protein
MERLTKAPTTLPAPPDHAASRTGVVAGLLAGGLLVVVPALVELVAGDLFVLVPIALLAMLVALPGLRRHQRGLDGRAGSLGLRLLNTGLLGAIAVVVVGSIALDSLSSGAQDVAEPVLMLLAGLCAGAAILGLVLLTTGMVRARVYPVPAVLLFGVGLVLGLATEVWEQSLTGAIPTALDVLPPALLTATGVGLLGIALAARRGQLPAAQDTGTPRGQGAGRH